MGEKEQVKEAFDRYDIQSLMEWVSKLNGTSNIDSLSIQEDEGGTLLTFELSGNMKSIKILIEMGKTQ